MPARIQVARMLHALLTGVAVVLACLSIGLIGLWIRSYWVFDVIQRLPEHSTSHHSEGITIFVDAGALHFGRTHIDLVGGRDNCLPQYAWHWTRAAARRISVAAGSRRSAPKARPRRDEAGCESGHLYRGGDLVLPAGARAISGILVLANAAEAKGSAGMLRGVRVRFARDAGAVSGVRKRCDRRL